MEEIKYNNGASLTKNSNEEGNDSNFTPPSSSFESIDSIVISEPV